VSGMDSPIQGGLHTDLIKSRLPGWINHATEANIKAIGRSRVPGRLPADANPEWLARASPELRQRLRDSQARSRTANEALARTLKDLKGITEFCEPLLKEALRAKFAIEPDLKNTLLYHMRHLKKPIKHSLLQAALGNFEADMAFDEQELGAKSAIAPKDALRYESVGETLPDGTRNGRYFYSETLDVTPSAFSALCRKLDLGKQYQSHLRTIFDSPASKTRVREQMIAALKATVEVGVHLARIKGEITQAGYDTLRALLNGQSGVTFNGHPVVYSQLSMLGSALGEIVIIGASARAVQQLIKKGEPWTSLMLLNPIPFMKKHLSESEERIIVYMPGAPLYPIKEYASLNAFEHDLRLNLRSVQYQRFMTGFVKHDESGSFLAAIKEVLFTLKWNDALGRRGMYEQVYDEEANLRFNEAFFSGELFGELHTRHLERMKANARLLAVPTEEVDNEAFWARLMHYANLGLNFLNVAAFFVPGLGEVMMAVAAVQLSVEVFQGIEAWEDGDTNAAWAHLESVALNVAFMAALGAAGALANKAPPILNSRWVDGLVPVKLPNGEARLWKPDLTPYRSSVTLDPEISPDALGHYRVGDKIYIKLDGHVYEKAFDTEAGQWRIQHPSNPDAYQPLMQHNGRGAWRHHLERPLEWDRKTLLRRMGRETDGFTDQELARIADISGIGDDALRKMHIDNLPTPPLLRDALHQFRVDRQVNDLIGLIRSERPVNDEYVHLLPFIGELPNWPRGRVLEVFDGPMKSGPSTQYGNPASTDVNTIRLINDEVANSGFPDNLLAGLDEQEITALLGGEGARVPSMRGVVLRERLGELALSKKTALFDNIHGAEPVRDPLVKLFKRHHSGLSTDAATELLANASELERSKMRDNQRVPLRLAEEARWYVQQSRLNRALAGLRLDSMAAIDSDRLALHALEKLPGWPADVRLEMRDGSMSGQLLDSIGSEGAPVSKYLVKQPSGYQAFNERGESLNSVPRHQRNFYASIMHALPDNARQSLKLPHVGQSADLEKLLSQYALDHRSDMALALGQRPVKPWFKPPMRLADGRTGYPLSGRGEGRRASPSLIARVEDIFPGASELDASLFVYRCQLEGKTDQQILHLLNSKARELETLRSTLNDWAAQDAQSAVPFASGPGARQRVADRIIECWRRSFLGTGDEYQRLDLQSAVELPELPEGFSQVSELLIGRQDYTGAEAAAMLRRFPAVTKLTVRLSEFDGLPDALAELPSLTELTIEGYRLQYPAEFQACLDAMPNLERLSLLGMGSIDSIDVSHMTNLRELNLSGARLSTWPVGVLDLEHLGLLNLRGSHFSSLPSELFQGHERLWRGLLLDWSTLDHDSFMAAYAWLKDNPAHLRDIDAMVDSYCRNVISRTLAQFDSGAAQQFRLAGDSNEVMLARVGQIRQQEADLDRMLAAWQSRSPSVDQRPVDSQSLALAGQKLKSSWRSGLRTRYEPRDSTPGPSWRLSNTESAAMLDLSDVTLGSLPELVPNAFSHVTTLRLGGIGVALEELDGFLSHFSTLQELDIHNNALSELPSALNQMSNLNSLNASRNRIIVTPAVQQRLNAMAQLQYLNLQYNPLRTLDVSELSRLVILDLGHTAIRGWPGGFADVSTLRRLDLSYSAISTVPNEVWSGHDGVLSNTSLRGCKLTPQAIAEVQAWSRRTGNTLDIPADVLLEGRTGGEPEYFSGEETQDSINRDLVPELPRDLSRDDPAFSLVNRLRRLDPDLNEQAAENIIELMRTKGLPFMEIDDRITQWRLQLETLRQQLNGWINIRTYREGNYRVSSTYRRRAADRILAVWRQQLRGALAVSETNPGSLLDLSDIPLGELPALTGDFSHVGTLNLAGASSRGQGIDQFFAAFGQVRTLVLNRNELQELPNAVTTLTHLQRLEAAHNHLISSEALSDRVTGLTQLRWLDLSNNRLDTLNVRGLARLEHLDLHDNDLTSWPEAVLDLPALRSLNLRHNQLRELPEAALTDHDILLSGTSLTENPLPVQELEFLREYSRRSGNSLGYHLDELDELIETPESDEGGDDDRQVEPENAQLERWLEGTDEAAEDKETAWNSLKDIEGAEDFFDLLSQLRHTKDFSIDRSGLTHRVWQVVDAAASNSDLRKNLFLIAERGYTCGDGRILRFSDLEVKVFEFNTLQSVVPEQEGRELFRLSRNLFRLGKVEEIAKARAEAPPKRDVAEVRLAYRIGLTERLELPAQPNSMRYREASGVTDDDIDTAFKNVIEAEKSDDFMDEIVRREYWIDYLKRKYRDDFSALEKRQAEAADALETRYPDLNEEYLKEIEALSDTNKVGMLELAVQLTEREREEIGL
jgi:Leucine-rich repeat (LRR) protein